MADQGFGGLGAVLTSGHPKTAEDRISIHGGYEIKDQWRFSFTNTALKYESTGNYKMSTQILGGEQMWVKRVNEGYALIGALGAGLFLTSLSGNVSGSGYAIGLLATGTGRFAISKTLFVDVAIHYRNAGVAIDDYAVDAGYKGLIINLGMLFN